MLPKDEQPGLEVVPPSDTDKQVVQPEKEALRSYDDPDAREKQLAEPLVQPDGSFKPWDGQRKDDRKCGMKRGLFWGLLAMAVILVLGLAIGLGVGLSSQDSDESPEGSTTTETPPAPSSAPIDEASKVGGSLDASYFSGEGAWNGTGIVHTWQTFSEDLEDTTAGENLVVYYQHHSGDIRWLRRTNRNSYVRGPSDSEVVADDAKNSTPIAAVHLNEGQTKVWHVFYLDENYQIRQRSGNNESASWTDGSINDANLTAHNGDLVGMHACWAGENASVPMRLWYASDNTTFEEYVSRNDEWVWQRSWENYNGAAGIGCYSWGGSRDFIYAAFVNLKHDVEIWYQNTTDPNSEGWQQTDVVISGVHRLASVSLSEFVCAVQKSDSNELQVSKINWKGGNTTRSYDRAFSLEGVVDSVGGTRLTTFSKSNGAGGSNVYLLNQVNGDDITEFYRDVDAPDGTWSRNEVDAWD